MAVYKIVEFLGEGGFAFVYRAKDLNLDIEVALKVLKPAFAYDEVFEQNFRREAHRAAKFRHPNVIAIHYAGKEEDVVFFSMDLLERGLEDVIREGPAEEETIIKVGSDVASALEFAHSHEGGLVHRDLKPDNILFDRHGNAVVTDFGIAEAATNYTQATGTTVYVGTPAYMSPEQARGRKVDGRSDIYSLGATLYEMATGSAPFEGRDWFELGRKHIEVPPVPPRERGAGISDGLERVILQCLEKDPEDRYQSAREIDDQLEAVAGGTVPTMVMPSPRTGARETEREAPAARKERPAARKERPREKREKRAAAKERRKREPDARILGMPRPVFALVLLAALVVGAGAAYRFNVAGLQRQFPQLARLPLLSAGPVYAEALSPTLVEGEADVGGPITLAFSGVIDASTATSEHIHLVGPRSDSVPLRVTVPAEGGGRRAVLVPLDSLRYETEYELTLDDGFLSAAGNPVTVRPGGRLAFTTQPDRRPPVVLGSVPARGAEGASVEEPITLAFNEPVRPLSVNGATISLLSEAGEAVPLEFSFLSSGDSVKLYLGRALERGERYRVLLSAGDSAIVDLSGNQMGPDTLAFTTASAAVAERRPRPRPTGPSTLDIRITPADARSRVRVLLDGRDLGSPPAAGLQRQVEPGRSHLVEVRAKGGGGSEYQLVLSRQSVDAPAGRTRSVALEVRRFGWIAVLSQPPGEVYIDGEPLTHQGSAVQTPLFGFPVVAGDHTLEVRPTGASRDRYRVYRRSIQVTPFETVRLSVELPTRG